MTDETITVENMELPAENVISVVDELLGESGQTDGTKPVAVSGNVIAHGDSYEDADAYIGLLDGTMTDSYHYLPKLREWAEDALSPEPNFELIENGVSAKLFYCEDTDTFAMYDPDDPRGVADGYEVRDALVKVARPDNDIESVAVNDTLTVEQKGWAPWHDSVNVEFYAPEDHYSQGVAAGEVFDALG